VSASLQDTHAVAAELRGASTILLLTHESPDGDGLGSMLGLSLALRAVGKTVVCVVPQGCPDKYDFLPGAGDIDSEVPDEAFDVAVALDCDGEERLGEALSAFRAAGRTVSVDHHQSEARFGDVNWCDGSQAAAGLMVSALVPALDADLTPDIATCLYCAIATDTGFFRFQNTSPKALAVAAELVSGGADPSEIARQASDQMPVAKARLLGRTLSSIETRRDGRIVIAALTVDDFSATGALPQHTDGIIDDLKRIAGAEVIVLLREQVPSEWRVSLRSLDTDVAAVCRKHGGGGHRLAAGCELHGTADDVTEAIVGDVAAALNR